MAKRSYDGTLAVYLNTRRVGMLDQASTGAISFSYGADWLNWGHAISVSRTLPLNDTVYRGAVVFNVFDNLLPDIDRVRLNLAALACERQRPIFTACGRRARLPSVRCNFCH